MEKIELSVVMPCLNEEAAVASCIKKIKDTFAKNNIQGEIIVADNGSTDRSVEIAKDLGARLIIEHRRGYGAAYLAGLKEAKGKYILIADSDDTYDFRQIPRFLRKLDEGYDFVIGSRLKGRIKKQAMPFANRYIGTPMLTLMLRIFFGSKVSDIMSGMRAFTQEAYHKMRLKTLGMEFASEMIVAVMRAKLKIAEVNIDYYPRQGDSKLRPIPDAWRHIRFMLLYCPVWLYFIPGMLGLILGLGLLLLLLKGPVLFLGHQWDMHFIVFASMLSILSYQILNLGIYAHTYAIRQRLLRYDQFTLFFQRHFTLERGILLGLGLFLIGFFINFLILGEWFFNNFGPLYRIRESIFAMTLLVIGLQTIFSSFFVSLMFLKKR